MKPQSSFTNITSAAQTAFSVGAVGIFRRQIADRIFIRLVGDTP
jgi:hypothetical protein